MLNKRGNRAVLRLVFFPHDKRILPYFGRKGHEFQPFVLVIFHRAAYGEDVRLVLQGEQGGVVYQAATFSSSYALPKVLR